MAQRIGRGDFSPIWYEFLLRRLDAPVNAITTTAMRLWAASEGINPAYNNWLGTTIDCCGGRSVNSHGVKRFPDLRRGVDATYRTLRLDYYARIVALLRRGNDLRMIYVAINRSAWCRDCQNNRYPIALYNALEDPPALVGPVDPPPRNREVTNNDWSAKIRATGRNLGRHSTQTQRAARDIIDVVRRRRG